MTAPPAPPKEPAELVWKTSTLKGEVLLTLSAAQSQVVLSIAQARAMGNALIDAASAASITVENENVAAGAVPAGSTAA